MKKNASNIKKQIKQFRVLLVLGRYLPGKTAGIENYSHFLATLLLENNYEVEAAILNGPNKEIYNYQGVTVIPLKDGLDSFVSLLQERRYNICHFQEYSGEDGININWFTAAKRYCRKVFFTFHLPYLTCYKNDFRYLGIEDCNNFSSPERCIKCIIATRLHYKGSKKNNLYNFAIDAVIPMAEKTSKLKKVKNNIQARKKELKKLIATCDNIFIYGAWFKKILFENDYDSPKMKLIPHITKPDFTRKQRENFVKKKILYVGRIEPAKGLHLLVRAMNKISTQHIQLEVVGNVTDEKYFEACKVKYSFNYKGTLPRTVLLQSLPEYDFLVLPSVFTEMYSLILKEAFYEQLPVIVSSAKGNRDVVREEENGFIFEYGNAKDLARKIDEAYTLLTNGWQPIFLPENDIERDEEQILSYYQ